MDWTTWWIKGATQEQRFAISYLSYTSASFDFAIIEKRRRWPGNAFCSNGCGAPVEMYDSWKSTCKIIPTLPFLLLFFFFLFFGFSFFFFFIPGGARTRTKLSNSKAIRFWKFQPGWNYKERKKPTYPCHENTLLMDPRHRQCPIEPADAKLMAGNCF